MIFDAEVLSNDPIGGDNWILRLSTGQDISEFRAGAFYHLKVDPGPFPLFRRAYSVLSATKDSAEVLYKVTGAGTRLLSRRRVGDTVSAMGPLGNTFMPLLETETALLVAGGVGVPPILRWAENLIGDGVPKSRIIFLFGARTANELVLRDRLASLGVPIRYATDDGTEGYHGRITDLCASTWQELKAAGQAARYYACGPGPMLKACTELSMKLELEGEVALETPMPCGSGVCLGCIIPTRSSAGDLPTYRRTCIDGPIFPAREVLWP